MPILHMVMLFRTSCLVGDPIRSRSFSRNARLVSLLSSDQLPSHDGVLIPGTQHVWMMSVFIFPSEHPMRRAITDAVFAVKSTTDFVWLTQMFMTILTMRQKLVCGALCAKSSSVWEKDILVSETTIRRNNTGDSQFHRDTTEHFWSM